MRKFSAEFIFRVSQSPVKNGIVVVEDDGFIKDVIDPAEIDYEIENVETYSGIICPGFINAHCHIELSFLKNKILKHTGLDNFIKEIELKRNEKIELIEETIESAEKEMIANGIVAVGDISNNDFSFKLKSKKNLYYHTFIEVFSFDPQKADIAFQRGETLKNKLLAFDPELKYSITPHAPYSCSKELFLKLTKNAKINSTILTIHNQENEEENLFFVSKTGRLVDRLKYFGINIEVWQEPKKKSLEYITDLLEEEIKILLVHNTVTREKEINYATLKNKNLWWCLCPKANLYIENKLPDLTLFKNKLSGRTTIGTDSLASNNSLSVLGEIQILQQKFSMLELENLVKWGTLNGAQFLEIDNLYGSLEKGKKPGINLIENVENNFSRLHYNSRIKKLL